MGLEEMLKAREEWLSIIVPETTSAPDLVSIRKQCARLCLDMHSRDKEIEAIYHLSEAHGISLRQEVLRQLHDEQCDQGKRETGAANCLSFQLGSFANLKSEGLLQRLKEMPSEWTIVQLTREYDANETFYPRPASKAAGLQRFHLVRLPCGSTTSDLPVCLDCSWPGDYKNDPTTVFYEVKTKWKNSKGLGSFIVQTRKEASELAENYCMDLATACFKEWRVALLGRMVDSDLEYEIRMRLERVVKKSATTEFSNRQRYLLNLIAQGSPHLSEEEIEIGIRQIFNDESLVTSLYEEILNIRTCYSQLATTKLHPVILVLDDHLDAIPWESSTFMKNHPYCRMPSVHFIHYGFRLHQPNIKRGLVEIEENQVCFYVVNPDNDLNSESLLEFFKKRFPSWVGVVNQPPTSDQLMDAFQKYKIFTYCGHGSGSQYLQKGSILKLDMGPSIQFLFGCSSGALVDLGGEIQMTGHVLNYIAAGSGCTVGMLWAITNKDSDAMTIELVNRLMSTTPINNSRNAEFVREPELLRALKYARESVSIFSNGAALIARGLPMVIK